MAEDDGDGDNYIQVGLRLEAMHVRDSTDTDLRPFAVSLSAWSALTAYASNADC
ncbi:DUF397 domain-containing protein [Streptomyces sp. NPDC058613]|uniref:DUF397 domain-containing protein n=1 Tax=Streptomyces sp. NPDC058613 TaxID=3346556 RepID=UPI0036522D36